MRKTLFLFLLFSGNYLWANMASPITFGTESALAFSSMQCDIINEKIDITIHENFSLASYKIEYHILTDTGGVQIPLLFYARNYKDDFKVWLDGKEVDLITPPYEYPPRKINDFENFSSSFSPSKDTNESQRFTVQWRDGAEEECSANDLKYFKVNLSKGEHQIRVEYDALPLEDRGEWISKYQFSYMLSPARHWRSFGKLEIALHMQQSDSPITTNLGKPLSTTFDTLTIWEFSKLPDDIIEINYEPKINSFAAVLIAVNPVGFTFICAFLIFFFNYQSIRNYKRDNPGKKYFWVIAVSSIGFSFFILVSFMLSFNLIDLVIGSNASKYHGYTFMIFLLYPILVPVYGFLMWLFLSGKDNA
jgi:hypothetical protein